MATIELDEKGRALLPASIRKKLGAKRFEVKVVNGRIEMMPIGSVRALKGKYRGLLREPWSKIEERAERIVRQDRR